MEIATGMAIRRHEDWGRTVGLIIGSIQLAGGALAVVALISLGEAALMGRTGGPVISGAVGGLIGCYYLWRLTTAW